MSQPFDAQTGAASDPTRSELPESKGQRSRQRLIDCSRKIFEDNGYTEARITDIAASAKMAVGSFYTYFESKEEIFLALVTQVHTEMFPNSEVSAARRPKAGLDLAGASESIARANRHYIEFYAQNSKLNATIESAATYVDAIRMYRQRLRRRSIDRTSQSIAQLQRAGLADPNLDPQITAAALVSMVSNFVYFWFVYDQDFDREEAVRHLSIIWGRALGFETSSFETP